MSVIKSLKELNNNLPNMSSTIRRWFLPISFDIVTRTLNGADWEVTSTQTINTKGVVRPPSDTDLKLLPDGTWSWQWLQAHCLPNVLLENNQFVSYDSVVYKVMAKKNYTPYGYIRYTILEAYQAEGLQ